MERLDNLQCYINFLYFMSSDAICVGASLLQIIHLGQILVVTGYLRLLSPESKIVS